jgi:uncharacterized protein YjbI with pentapeptide repeats
VADEKALAILKQGSEAWNKWRRATPGRPDLGGANLRWTELSGANFTGAELSGADLGGANLRGAELSGANFTGAELSGADLTGANFSRANLRGTDLTQANLFEANLRATELSGANFTGADLTTANLCAADLHWANLSGAELIDADLSEARLLETLFVNTSLASVVGLETCHHHGPSTLDHRTLTKSGQLPLSFLRGCGLPDKLIDYLPSLLLNHPIQFYSCFISFSTKDQEFADRLHADLQNKGVRCWFAPHKIQGGKKIHEQIDEAIRIYDRLLLILSEQSMESEWMKTEIAHARQKELNERRKVLFPISLASFAKIREWKYFDADTGKDSAREIREYFIPDFSRWKDHDSYQMSFKKLLRDLNASA